MADAVGLDKSDGPHPVTIHDVAGVRSLPAIAVRVSSSNSNP